MQKTLYGLLELQEVDNRLDELKEEKGDLPLIVEDLESKLKAKNKELEEVKKKLKETKLRQRELELLIDEYKAKLSKYEDQLYQVKTNKEYDAITQETETVQTKLSESKQEQDQAEEAIIDLDEKTVTLESEIAKLENELEENQVELNAKLNETAEEENLLKHEREIILNKANPDIIRTYERVRNARDGQGIAKIEGNVCGGCFSFIPPQKIVEVKKMQKIYTCEFCGRILVWAEAAE